MSKRKMRNPVPTLGTTSDTVACRLDLRASEVPSNFKICGASEGFELQADASNPAKLKRFTMTAYTGAAMRLQGFYWPVVVDLEGMQAPRQTVPILKNHDTERIVGHTDAIEVSAQRIKVAGLISGTGEDAQEVVGLAANGFPWQASIGANATKMEFVDREQTVKVNGRNFTGPLYVARGAILGEVSFVPIGADGGTSANVAAAKPTEVDMNFSAWLKARGHDEAKLTDAEKTLLKATFDAEQKLTPPSLPAQQPVALPAAAPLSDDQRIQARRDADAAEDLRVISIRKITADNPDLQTEIEAGGKKVKVNIRQHAITAGWTKEQAHLAFLQESRPTIQGGLGYVSGNVSLNQDEHAQALEASLCVSARCIPDKMLVREYGEKVMNIAATAPFRGARISTIMHACIQAANMQAPSGNVSDATIRVAIKADQQLRAEGFSTIGLGGILSNLANKSMIASYEAQALTWPFIAAERNLNDFKIHTRYRMDQKGSFKKVAPTGEIEHVGLSEAGYTLQLDTFGAMIALNRQMMINDDLSAFTQIPTFLGRMASIRVEEAIMVLLLSNPVTAGVAFFSTTNKNIVTGAGGAMTAANGLAAITAAEQKFVDQVDSNAKPILITPSRMLLGTANYVAARNIYEGRLKITGENSTQVADNEHVGKYQPYRSPYINNTAIKDQDGNAIAGQSATLWYLFADPAVRAAMAIGFLNGKKIPTIESADTEFDTLGMQWRSYMDFGVGMEDPVAAVKVNGA